MNHEPNAATGVSGQWEKIVALTFLAYIVLFGSVLLWHNEPIKDPNLVVLLRFLISVGAGALGMSCWGFLHVNFSVSGLVIRAGGAIGFAVLTWIYTPTVFPSLTTTSTTVLGPNQYPPESIISVWPTAQQLASKSKFPPDKVTFSYRNDSGVDLKLFVFDFYRKQHPQKGAFATPFYWSAWPFPSDNQDHVYDEFHRTNGWFGFAIGKVLEDGKSVDIQYLQTMNIFYAKSPELVVGQKKSTPGSFESSFIERK